VGTYLIDVFPQDLQQSVGSYTLSLCGNDDDDDDVDDLDDCFDDDDSVSGTRIAPGPGVGFVDDDGEDNFDDGFDDDD
jgi:hypothetical protein